MQATNDNPDVLRQEKIDPIGRRVSWLSTPHAFAVVILALLTKFHWPQRWLISGAPLLTYSMLLGAAQGTRFLPFIPLWPFFATLHLAYSIAATSWLLYWLFAAICYPLVLFSCLFQFDVVGRFVRRKLRAALKGSQFVNDKIALFNLPALEIDTEVDGLMVIRGITLSLSSLKIVAHGVEVGIKLQDDIELAIITDKVTVWLFRKIEIDDVYANLKGGKFEMTFADVDTVGEQEPGQSTLLRAATLSAQDILTPMVEISQEASFGEVPKARKRADTIVSPPQALESALEGIQTVSDDNANDHYESALRRIHESSLITRSRNKISAEAEVRSISSETTLEPTVDPTNDKHMRAAICARLHDKPSIQHPPETSISVTTLQNQSSPATRRFLHRLPMLLRLLLNPLSYFHPIKISSVTASGSGTWIQHMLSTFVFRHYSDKNSDIRRLEARVNAWLTDVNFVLQLESMGALANVPFLTAFDIEARLAIADVIVYRVLQDSSSIAQVIRIGGANASVAIPSFLLPHHEHLFPPVPSEEDVQAKERQVDEADGLPKTVEATTDLKQTIKDEVNINISARARLPAVFDQQLLDFIAALVKATKFIEIEKGFEDQFGASTDEAASTVNVVTPDTASDISSDIESPTSASSSSNPRWSDFKISVKTLNKKAAIGMEKTWRRGIVGGMANDRWIAKLVGKVTKLLETVNGDVGYSGDFPVPMAPYRAMAEKDAKILA